MLKLIYVPFLLIVSIFSEAQESIAGKLGLPLDAKMLILHADDLGVAHAVNEASIEAFEKGRISSASIMVPCPWFSEIAAYARSNPDYCYGLHLTLTSEWKYYKWDGVSPSNTISSLLNEEGYFYDNVPEFVENAQLEEVEREIRAQVDKALKAGIPVSHLDSHMGSLFANAELFAIYVRVGNDYDLPVMIPGAVLPPSWKESVEFGPQQFTLNNLMMLQNHVDSWDELYDRLLDGVQPGLNEIIVHLAFDNAEMQAIMVDHPAFGSEWRQKDFDYIMSDKLSQKLEANNIYLVSYREIKEAIQNKK